MNIWVVRLVLLVGMAALSWYAFETHDEYYPSIWDYLNDPARFEGQEGDVIARVLSVQKDSFTVNARGAELVILGNTDQAVPGDLIRIHGVYEDNSIRILDADRDFLFRIKQLFSLATLLVVGIFFLAQYKITWQGFEHA